MRIPMIAGNWKMNTTVSEAVTLVKAMKEGLDSINNVDKVVCPPFVSLAPVSDLLKGSSIKVGAQNVYFAEKGAYTGEIAPGMLAELCTYVIIGHSERRQYFHETGDIVNKKIAAALTARLIPILCVGEKLEDNEAGKTEEVVTGQLKSSLSAIKQVDELIVAYEPIWAIGTGRAATSEQANATVALIRQYIARLYNNDIADKMRILYGGSVTAANTEKLLQQPDIDGALVGGASLKAAEFINMVAITSQIAK